MRETIDNDTTATSPTHSSPEITVFHLDIDISGTGMRYDVGSALGVYGHNDRTETSRFLEWYGVPANTIVDNSWRGEQAATAAANIVALQTAFRVFSQELDIFGRPTRDFYVALASHAKDPREAAQLAMIGNVSSARGAEQFVEREDEGFTFADVLREFPSAHPSVDALIALLPRIKPRHYSIASAQRAHRDAVHLLVVEVAW